MRNFIISEYLKNNWIQDIKFCDTDRDKWVKYDSGKANMVIIRDENYNQV